MRKAFLLAALVVACAKKETPAADTAAAPPPPPPPPPPAAITAADVKGTWTATAKREGDTTTTAFTFTNVTDSTGKLTFTKTKQTVDYSVKYDADSTIATSKPYNDPNMPKGAPKVTFRSVGRMKDGKFTGTAALMLASKPDSVVSRSTWEATKAP
jgi:hypothetical protein